MKTLFAPWRSDYTNEQVRGKTPETTTDECVFCAIAKDTKTNSHFVLKKTKHCFVVLNKYPYNAGHLLVISNKHVPILDKLKKETRTEIMELVSLCTEVVTKELKCDGVNIGINIGKAAGAGIPAHLHTHVLPRWVGDTNFMPTLGQTKVISFNVTEIFEKLKKHF